MVFLPRLARSLGHPAVASLLGVLLITVSVIGFATDDISKGWAILIGVVGIINVIHGLQNRRATVAGDSADPAEPPGA
jgi:hypothetical protein